MRISNLHKTSLIDFPGIVSAIVFTQGCNFTCPYCHNPDLIPANTVTPLIPDENIFAFLKQRQGLLQGLVITGGEPTVQADLVDFCGNVKKLGYSIKLDTNASNPKVVQELLQKKLIDYIALDIKADPYQYPSELTKVQPKIKELLSIMEQEEIPFEVRTTCVEPFINAQSFSKILQILPPNTRIYLQKARIERVYNPDFFTVQESTALSDDDPCKKIEGKALEGKALTDEQILHLQKQASNFICEIR